MSQENQQNAGYQVWVSSIRLGHTQRKLVMPN